MLKLLRYFSIDAHSVEQLPNTAVHRGAAGVPYDPSERSEPLALSAKRKDGKA
jgi:hypothetical protein